MCSIVADMSHTGIILQKIDLKVIIPESFEITTMNVRIILSTTREIIIKTRIFLDQMATSEIIVLQE